MSEDVKQPLRRTQLTPHIVCPGHEPVALPNGGVIFGKSCWIGEVEHRAEVHICRHCGLLYGVWTETEERAAAREQETLKRHLAAVDARYNEGRK